MTPGKQLLQAFGLLTFGLEEHVIRIVDQFAKQIASFGRGFRTGNHRRVAGQPDESGLSQQTGSPAVAFTSRETGHSTLMKWMAWPGEREQDVCVQQK